ncbi:hypothetical protein SAMN05660473_01964 [Arthrobacter sp. 49Tsu3.1M3]|uniref:hypothetical protein n=1 Tax=Arthrobacter sp. 49Tsu3.1M3 TaxID=1279029 RepID=UPI0009A6316C|nr:hypothetical protein [Arthrobacter sp. 49Tsu3.1M3]SKB69423.1 hypothetical protein SAMN05660473_01964 [Arthrobacter sp. 49Tsu3.1M3]
MLNLDLLLAITAHLLTGNENDPATGSTAQNIASTIEYTAASAAAILLLGLLLLIIKKSKRRDQTIEDSEAAVRHFLPM